MLFLLAREAFQGWIFVIGIQLLVISHKDIAIMPIALAMLWLAYALIIIIIYYYSDTKHHPFILFYS